jgi:hypothetical protein
MGSYQLFANQLKVVALTYRRGPEMDLYTKIVLTVIAGALSAIALQNLASSARAQAPSLTHVVVCDSSNPNRCAGISDKGWLDVQTHAPN